ncbi:YeeE/YedE family protein [Undibacterium sp. Ji49W]|uniref:YeeE/YedE family protein n=1 Tax=Undibacterium sp. Ji49W TaxID=3413040 RepID=UPI003BF354ED
MTNLAMYTSLAGGALIGISAALLLWATGRIAGISNIAGNLFAASSGERWWRVLFLLGLIGGAGIYYVVAGHAPAAREHFPSWLLAVAGLLVGFGTSLANGCTSGHGVCGIGRLSTRSFVATLLFLSTGIVTALVVRHFFKVF